MYRNKRYRFQVTRFVAVLIITLMGLGVQGASVARAASIVVTTTTDEINTNGQCSLREAIINANNDDQSGSTDCAAGSGDDTITFAVDGTFTLDIGATNENAALDGDLDITDTDALTLSGNGAQATIIAGNAAAESVFTVRAGTVTITGVTITNGHAGGIANLATLTLNDSIISGNSAMSGQLDGGGGIHNNNGTLTVINCTISGNSSDNLNGTGGIHNGRGGNATITNSIISSNTCTYALCTGGIYNFAGSRMTITLSVISGNSATMTSVGGIQNNSSALTVTHSTISDNSVIGRNGGTMLIADSTISGNKALNRFGGGILNDSSSITTITHSSIISNSARLDGGGIYNASTLNLQNTLVAGNSAGTGSEVYYSGGALNADHYNLFGHVGETNAAAFYNFTPGASDITATSDGSSPTALASILAPTLADNGGPTRSYALVSGSPAIDQVSSAECSGQTDQRGAARNFDGDSAGRRATSTATARLLATNVISARSNTVVWPKIAPSLPVQTSHSAISPSTSPAAAWAAWLASRWRGWARWITRWRPGQGPAAWASKPVSGGMFSAKIAAATASPVASTWRSRCPTPARTRIPASANIPATWAATVGIVGRWMTPARPILRVSSPAVASPASPISRRAITSGLQ